MAIRIRFPADEPPRVELTSYPVAELVLSLHAVADSRQHAALAPFVRRVRSRLPREVLTELRHLSLVLGPPAPAPFAFPGGEPMDIPSALDAVSPDDASLRWTLEVLADEVLSRRELQNGDAHLVAELQRDPKEIAERLLRLLRDYWTYAFADEWPVLEAQLALARRDAELRLARGGIGALLVSTTRRARLNGDGIAVTPTLPAEHDVPLASDGRLPVALSLFSAPWVITRISPSAGLVLPAPAADRRVTPPGLELVRRLDALADPTRLTLLRLVGERPRSTRELSQLLELSEATVSKHLRRLADAGLVGSERSGYYVLYRLVPERAAAASDSLREFLQLTSDSPVG